MKRAFILIVVILSALGACLSCVGEVCAAATFVMRGKVADGDGRPVEGAEIYIYDSARIRRPADFITPKTDGSGQFRIELPVRERYWVVARVRKGDQFGPLMPGDKHSGEPVEIEPGDRKELERDFVVAGIQDVSLKKQKTRADFVRVKGRVIDKNGLPMQKVFVFASRSKTVAQLPDYISAWTDGAGMYRLYLPEGEYYLGIASEFSSGAKFAVIKKVLINPGKAEAEMDVELPRQ